ncbi:hypothetical protein ScPMuIL_012130 [Solemya velum]
MLRILLALSIPTLIRAQGSSYPFRVENVNVITEAQVNGNLTLQAGLQGGNVHLSPGGSNGSVFFEGNDLQYIIELVQSLPPIWLNHTPFGYLGKFVGGQTISIQLYAKDPEGSLIEYTVVAGDPPPGISVSKTGKVTGLVPDEDATYIFTVRATDKHNKFADEVMKIVIRDGNACKRSPCQHEGVCSDGLLDYHCTCVHPYGGKNCQDNCTTHSFGVGSKSRIADAQMSAYNTLSSYFAYNGRLGGSGWYGINNQSWLQVDLGNVSDVFAVTMQGISVYYYTSRYHLQYSIDGYRFLNFETATKGTAMTFYAPASSGSTTTTLPHVLAASEETRGSMPGYYRAIVVIVSCILTPNLSGNGRMDQDLQTGNTPQACSTTFAPNEISQEDGLETDEFSQRTSTEVEEVSGHSSFEMDEYSRNTDLEQEEFVHNTGLETNEFSERKSFETDGYDRDIAENIKCIAPSNQAFDNPCKYDRM